MGVSGRIPKWNHLAAAWDSPNSNPWGLSDQTANGTSHQIPRLTGESRSLSQNGVPKVWNQKRHRRSCCLSHTKSNKQRQGLNLYWCIIQMASDLRRQQVCTITKPSYIFFPNQTFITGNKQGVVRGFEIQGELRERNCSILVLGSYLFPGIGGHLSLPGTQWPRCLHFSPGGNL